MLIIFSILYITSILLIYLINGSLYLLADFILTPSPQPQPLVTTNMISFSMSLFICIYSIIVVQH